MRWPSFVSVAAATILAGCGAALAQGAVPTFTDPAALVTWLVQHSNGRGFRFSDDAQAANVFSPGLRSALRASFARSRQRNEPPCGADGDIILETQEEGTAQNLRLALQQTAPDRVTVTASFDVDGYHRAPQFMAVLLDKAWKVENIRYANGTTLRRALECRR